MSFFRDRELICRRCGRRSVHKLAQTINATTRRDLRDQIMDETFQRIACTCSATMVADGPFILVDFPGKCWLEIYPAAWVGAWQVLETDTRNRFKQAVRDNAPMFIRDQASAFTVRTTFGFPALREKLVALDAGIDDLALEALKLDIVSVERELVAAGVPELRLRAVTDDALQLASRDRTWSIARDKLGEFAGPRWHQTRRKLAGEFTDIMRVMIAGDEPRP